LETTIQKKWHGDLEGLLISDTRSLLQGRIAIRDEIHHNIETYLASQWAFRWGISPQIFVRTKTGEWLYPSPGQEAFELYESDTFSPQTPTYSPKTMLQVAEENLKIMGDGIVLSVAVQIPRNAWTANAILAFYILLFTLVLYVAYQRSRSSARRQDQLNQETLARAHDELQGAQRQLSQVTEREQTYVNKIKFLKTDLEAASHRMRATEDEALAEMETLENKLHESVTIKERLESEVRRLTDELGRMDTPRAIPFRKKRKEINRISKRFRTLYKNLDVQPRAVEGFLNLQSDLQLRAEEFIHNMNQGANRPPVKRKVFSRKGPETAFECEFAYRGRIYWKPGPGNKTEILAIGTKNSQAKDLAYLEGL
jgi:hypothetical protein